MFSTDYPHPEGGGTHCTSSRTRSLTQANEDCAKFFHDNMYELLHGASTSQEGPAGEKDASGALLPNPVPRDPTRTLFRRVHTGDR